MSESLPLAEGSWVSAACTLPTVEQPLREAEFDDVFRTAVRAVERIDATRVRLDLVEEASVAGRVADLMVRETCCSFFTFALTATAGDVHLDILDITVPAAHAGVLEALAARPERIDGCLAETGLAITGHTSIPHRKPQEALRYRSRLSGNCSRPADR